MKNKKILVAAVSVLVAVILISTLGSTFMQVRSQAVDEPRSLSDLVNYPGEVMSHDLTAEQIQTEMISMQLTGTVRGIPVEGINEVKTELFSKGLMPNKNWVVDSFFDVFTDIQIWSPDGLENLQGTAFKGWTNTMLDDGSKAMIAGVVLFDPQNPLIQYSMIMAVPTNVLPPEQMPGVDPYIIWNAEPYFYIQHYWWISAPWSRLVSWRYWWYDSHKAPNWFWGTYWWWRVYIKSYTGYYRWWYWWWWGWYYWRGWYWWTTDWPYI